MTELTAAPEPEDLLEEPLEAPVPLWEPAPPVELEPPATVPLPAAAPVVLWNLALMEATKANEAITLVNCIVDYIYV